MTNLAKNVNGMEMENVTREKLTKEAILSSSS